MSTLKQDSPLITLPKTAATNILSGIATEDWLLFYLGGKAQPHSPYTNMEGFDISRIYLCEFDDFELAPGAQHDVKRAHNYSGTPKNEIALKRWTADTFHGYRLEDILSFAWKDVITHGGQTAQLLVRREGPVNQKTWRLEYRSNAKNERSAEHGRMMEVFFGAIDGGTFQIEKLESPIPVAGFAGEGAQMSNVHGGICVGYDDRAYWAIKRYAEESGTNLGHHPAVLNSAQIGRELPQEWLAAVGR